MAYEKIDLVIDYSTRESSSPFGQKNESNASIGFWNTSSPPIGWRISVWDGYWPEKWILALLLASEILPGLHIGRRNFVQILFAGGRGGPRTPYPNNWPPH